MCRTSQSKKAPSPPKIKLGIKHLSVWDAQLPAMSEHGAADNSASFRRTERSCEPSPMALPEAGLMV